MNRYADLRHRHHEEFNALPLGFAFNDKQFVEMMKKWGLDPEKDTDKIYRVTSGGFIQKKDHARLHEVMDKCDKEMQEAIAADTTGDGFIYEMFLYELKNHEYSYTGDLEETLDALGYSMEEVLSDSRLKHGLEKAASAALKE